MASKRETAAAKYFNCSERERAVFESGIKLGTIYHQFVGTPLSSSNVESLEKAIEEGVRVQPFVKDVEVHIKRKVLRGKKDEYDYQTLDRPYAGGSPDHRDRGSDGGLWHALHR